MGGAIARPASTFFGVRQIVNFLGTPERVGGRPGLLLLTPTWPFVRLDDMEYERLSSMQGAHLQPNALAQPVPVHEPDLRPDVPPDDFRREH